MKSLFFNLIVVLVVLAGWVIFDNWDKITKFSLASVRDTIHRITPEQLLSAKKEQVTTSTVYQWADAEGNHHFSNKSPGNVAGVEILHYRSDKNVIPAGVPRQKKTTESSASHSPPKTSQSIFTQLPGVIQEAKGLEQKLKDRKDNIDRILSEEKR